MSVTAVPLRPLPKGSVVKLWLALALLVAIGVAVAWAGTSAHVFQRTPSGLGFKVLKDGEGAPPTASDVTLIQYTGRLEDGTVFDSNMNGQPLPMPAADGAAIKGFTEGLRMMKKGGTYRLRIPPQLGYGASGQPPAIPPNATLEFDVKLLEYIPMATYRALMQQQMMQQMQQMQQQGGAGAAPGGGAPGGGAPSEAPPPQGQPAR
jgi:FKBP-type peptidyl-prolyl cis-trans isomerase FkpA